MKRITVEDVLLQTVVTLVNLGGRRLGLAGSRRRERGGPRAGKAAIEGARALLPLLPHEEQLGPVQDALSQLQMAYVAETGGTPAGSAARAGPAQAQSPPGPSSDGRRRDVVGVFGGSGFYSSSTTSRRWPSTRRTAAFGPDRLGEIEGTQVASCPATATSTRCRRIASTTARTSGRCAASAFGGSWARRACGSLRRSAPGRS